MNSIPGTSSARIVGEKTSERGEGDRTELPMDEVDGVGNDRRAKGWMGLAEGEQVGGGEG